MSPDDLRRHFEGVIGFPVTPFKTDLSLDLPALRRNVAAMMRQPLAAIVAAGGTGELYSLTPEEHREVVAAVVAAVKGRAPVIAGVGYNPAIATALAREAARAGADGILAFPPYYGGAPEDGLTEYYRSIGTATGGAATGLGLLVYARDWFNPGPAEVARIAEAVPTLCGWKDGQGDLRRLQMIRQRVGDRLAWIGGVGDDLVPGYYALGLRCYTSSISNLAPRLAIDLHTRAAAGDSAALGRLMSEYVIPLYAFRARRRGYEVSVMKAAMDIAGLAGGPVRPPLTNLTAAEIDELRAMLKRWTAVLQAEVR